MLDRLLWRMAAILTLVTLSATAPAGPDDGVPFGNGDGPECCVHAPSVLSHSATTVTIWVHSFFMDGCEAAMYPSRTGLTLTAHNQYDRGDGTWDDEFVYSISPNALPAGQTITWQAEVLDFGWYDYWGAYAVSSIE